MSLRSLFLGGAIALFSMLFVLPAQAGGCDEEDDDKAANLHAAIFTYGYLDVPVFMDGYIRSGSLSDCEDEGDENGIDDIPSGVGPEPNPTGEGGEGGEGGEDIPEIVVTAPSWVEIVANILIDAADNYSIRTRGGAMPSEPAGSRVYEEEGCTGDILDTRAGFPALFNPYNSDEVTEMGGKSWTVSDGLGTEGCFEAD